MYGGFILVRGYQPIDVVRIPVHEGLWCTIICPGVVIRTKEARSILPASIPLTDVVAQTGNAAGLIAGLLLGDFALVGRSLHDVIAEPTRSALIPGFAKLKTAAMRSGALGCSISGSGPAVFALSATKGIADAVASHMGSVLGEMNLPFRMYVSGVSQRGARIVEGQA